MGAEQSQVEIDPDVPGFNFGGHYRLYVVELKPKDVDVPDGHVCIKYGRGNKYRPLDSAADFIKHRPYKIHVFSFDDEQETIDKENKVKKFNKKRYQPGIKIGTKGGHDSVETLLIDNESFGKLLSFMKKECNDNDSWNFKMWYTKTGDIRYKYGN